MSEYLVVSRPLCGGALKTTRPCATDKVCPRRSISRTLGPSSAIGLRKSERSMILSRKLSAPTEWNRRTTTSILRSPDFTARWPAAGRSPAGREATADRALDSPSALAWDGSFARN